MTDAEKLAYLTEIINLAAIQQLPKATEHFVSDLHGEYDAFDHILRNGSGRIREKITDLFGDTLSAKEQTELCFLIYYPEELLQEKQLDDHGWQTLMEQLVTVARYTSSKYTRSTSWKSCCTNTMRTSIKKPTTMPSLNKSFL